MRLCDRRRRVAAESYVGIWNTQPKEITCLRKLLSLKCASFTVNDNRQTLLYLKEAPVISITAFRNFKQI